MPLCRAQKREPRMGSILQFIEPSHAFDPESIQVLSAAYDRAMRELHDNGQPVLVQEIVAKRIIQLAARGERDPERLSETALASLGIKRD
jgi:hypothetical protein